VARAILDARRRRRRQQRQDHGQGNDRRDPRAPGTTLATRGILNNHIGVPLTLHRLEPRIASRSSRSARIIRARSPTCEARAPDVGLITNAGAEHLEGFGSLEGVARAEGEMVAGLEPPPPRCSTPTTNSPLWRGMTRARVSTFGVATRRTFRARHAHVDRRRGFVTRFSCARRGQRRSSCTSRAPQRAERAVRRGRRAAAGASLDDVRAGLPQCARFRADCSSKPRRVAPGSSTTLTTRTRVR
jgi:UDP-N-acetylmuramoyl-tripeptide--D-alanyl-D-alanine ligase